MSSISQPVPGEADEQAHAQQQQSDVPFQVSGQCNLGTDQTMNYKTPYEDFLPSGHEFYPMDLFTSAFEGEIDHSDFETGFEMNTSISASPQSCYSQDITVPTILGNVSQQQILVCEPVRSQEGSGIREKPVPKSSKRSSTKAFTPDHAEWDAGRTKQRARIEANDQDKTHSQFACPFQKLDPLKHHECLKYELNRVKDVKQHVYRRHRQPNYYCARCFVVFDTADARDEHARSKNCDNLEFPSFEGITEVERNKLNKKPLRGLSPQDQWFEMWDIIFPGKARPSSAWVGSHMEEMVPLLRSLWSRKNPSIVAKAEKKQARQLDRIMLDGVMETIFDCLEAEIILSLGRRINGTFSQGQQSPSGGQLPTSTCSAEITNGSQHSLVAEPHVFLQDIDKKPRAKFESGFVFGQP